MDKEDRSFIREVGSRAARVLKMRNMKLWNEFRKRCEENGEKPESVLGTYLWRFAKSLIDEDGEFAEDLLGRTIKISALHRRESLIKSLDEIVEIKKRLETAESSAIDKLIERLIETEIARTVITPVDMLSQDTKKDDRIVIDENLLASLPQEQLDALEMLINKVKEEKAKAMSMSVDDITEEVDYGEEEEDEYSGYGEDSNGGSEGIEELSERD